MEPDLKSKIDIDQYYEGMERFKLFLSQSPIPMAITNLSTGLYELVNNAFLSVMGYTEAEVIGKNSVELNVFADFKDREAALKEILEKGSLEDMEVMLNKKSGEQITILISARSVEFRDVTYLIIVSKDITKRKEMERALRLSEEKYRTLFENSAEMIIVFRRGKVLICNSMTETITGYSKEEFLMSNGFDFIYSEDLPRIIENHKRRLRGEQFEDTNIFRIIQKDGDLRWVEMHSVRIEWEDEAASLNFVTDITERKLSEEENTLVLQTTRDAFWLGDSEGNFKKVNNALCNLVGYSSDELLKMNIKQITPDQTDKDIMGRIKAIMAEGSKRFEAKHIKKDGEVFDAEVSVTYLPNSGRLCAFLHDITERKRKEKEIEYLSMYDVLTGLNNRACFEKECRNIDKEKLVPVSIIMGDLNGLKLTNDVFGHRFGDRLLCSVAEIMKECCRPGDMAARIGGDEFCMLLPNTDQEAAQKICEDIYAACESTMLKLGETIYHPSVSLGFAVKTRSSQFISDILKEAEDSMYKRKLLESKSMHSSLINNIRTTLFEKSHETNEHTERLAALAKKVGTAMKLAYDQMIDLELLSTLHDIGKIGVADHILCKPAPLNDEEWLEIKKHPEIGYRIALASAELIPAAEGILCHHERWDGKGYPQGLKGENIPLLARIISVVDSFDAMTHERVYHEAISLEQAKEEIQINSGKQFDPVVVQAFLTIVDESDI